MIILLALIMTFIIFTGKRTNEKGDFSLDKIITGQIKGLAIIMVILSHLNSTYLEWDFFRPFGAIGVAIFLFSSGYGLTKSYSKNGLIHFFKKRILTVMLPYILVTILWIVINSMLGVNHSLYTNLLSIFALDFNFTIDGTMWYIPYIMIWYLAFYLIFKSISNNELRMMSLFTVSALFIAGWIFNFSGPSRYHFGIHSLSFPIGVFYSMYAEKFTKVYKTKFLTLVVVASLSIGLLNIFFFFEAVGYYLINALFFMFVIVSFFIYLQSKGIKFRFLAFVGGYSYELYLMEGYLMTLIISTNNFSLQVSLWLFIVALIFMSYLLKKVTKFIAIGNIQNTIKKVSVRF